MIDVSLFTKPEHIKAANSYNEMKALTKNFVDSHSINDGSKSSHLSNALIKIEPAELTEPTMLFGGDMKTLITNKITLAKAIINTETNTYEAGDVIFQALISDKDFSTALFQSNGPDRFPCTFTQSFGRDIPLDNYHDSVLSRQDSNKHDINSHLVNYKEKIESILESVEKGSGVLSKKVVTELKTSLDTLFRNSTSNIRFQISQLIKEMDKKMSGVSSEMLSNVEKLTRFYRDLDVLTLPSPNGDNEEKKPLNLMDMCLTGDIYSCDAEIFAEMTTELLAMESVDEEQVKLVRKLSNNFVAEKNKKIKESHGSLYVCRSTGSPELFGVNSRQSGFVKFEFNSAAYESSFGSKRLNDIGVHNLLEFNLSYEHLLLLTRGNLTNEFIPCTLTGIASCSVPYVKQLTTEKEALNVTVDELSFSGETQEKYQSLLNTLKLEIKGKKARKDLSLMVSDFVDSLISEISELQDQADDHKVKINESYMTDLKKMTDDVIALVPLQDRHWISQRLLQL